MWVNGGLCFTYMQTPPTHYYLESSGRPIYIVYWYNVNKEILDIIDQDHIVSNTHLHVDIFQYFFIKLEKYSRNSSKSIDNLTEVVNLNGYSSNSTSSSITSLDNPITMDHNNFLEPTVICMMTN